MRNTKEIAPIFSALAALAYLDSDTKKLCKQIMEYAFDRILNSPMRMILLAVIARDENDVIKEVIELLEQETEFKYKEKK